MLVNKQNYAFMRVMRENCGRTKHRTVYLAVSYLVKQHEKNLCCFRVPLFHFLKC